MTAALEPQHQQEIMAGRPLPVFKEAILALREAEFTRCWGFFPERGRQNLPPPGKSATIGAFIIFVFKRGAPHAV
ncbi:MAG: hypothetical protein ACQEUY_17680, partial [Pseudomonadota bacterium]